MFFRITGVERFNGNLLQKEEFLMYPRNLKLFTFPPQSLDDFPAPIKDKMGISSNDFLLITYLFLLVF